MRLFVEPYLAMHAAAEMAAFASRSGKGAMYLALRAA
jgi:hypothetical protein